MTSCGPLTGSMSIPGDKSISHRALMLGAIAEGTSHISGFLDGDDTVATLNALRAMGVDVERHGAHDVSVHGVGLYGLQLPSVPIDLGNSGTSVRLMTGLLAGQAFNSELVGDASLMQRPMQRIIDPLRLMGADIQCTEQGMLPMRISGGQSLMGINYEMPVASAQLKSCLLLAGLYAIGKTCVTEPAITRDHTERMLAHFGCPVERSVNRICLQSKPLLAGDIQIPADISSATFFMLAASIVPDSDLLLLQIGVNPTRNAVIEILRRMGADLSLQNAREVSGEPVADIRVRYSSLKGIEIPQELVPIAIDEFPAILVAAAFAEGQTVLSGAGELRVKESDRIEAMAEGLKNLGIDVAVQEDGMVVQGGRPQGGEVVSYTDHRIAMAFIIAGLATKGPVTVRDCANINTSFPGFSQKLQGLGVVLEVTGSGE